MERLYSFRPLAGINCNLTSMTSKRVGLKGFRPLAGINCNDEDEDEKAIQRCFRPLAGINCNTSCAAVVAVADRFPSPRGDKLQWSGRLRPFAHGSGFRPLAGITCNPVPAKAAPAARRFPSPRGDKLQYVYGRLEGIQGRFRPLAGINCNKLRFED